MLKVILICLFICFLTIPLFAQSVDTAWVRRYNGLGNDIDVANAIAVDDFGNVYVTGSCDGENYIPGDYATIKYYPNGDTAWVRRYNGPANSADGATAIALDNSGNVYVTGQSCGIGTDYDYATIKYYPNGDTAWVRRYNGPGDFIDYALGIAIDNSGNVYVTGFSRDSSGTSYADYATIKYDPNGDTVWLRRYKGPGNYLDEPRDIALDDSGNAYVTGVSTGDNGTYYDYATIKYDPDGDTAWVRRYNGPGNYEDQGQAVVVDGYGNIYVTGSSFGSGTVRDYATIKYYPNGDTAWVRRYNGPGNLHDEATAIAIDDSGNIFVTGKSTGFGTNFDIATIKYYPNGDSAWVRRYNSPDSLDDSDPTIDVDMSGNIYVTGRSHRSETNFDYVTIKYHSNGDSVWLIRYNGPVDSGDVPYGIAVDSESNVYVTGGSNGSETCYDYATIKYVQFLRGDVNDDRSLTISDVVYLINYLSKEVLLLFLFYRSETSIVMAK